MNEAPASSTSTLITAMRVLSRTIKSHDGIVNAACAEAAMRLEAYHSLVVKLAAFLAEADDTLERSQLNAELADFIERHHEKPTS